MIEFELFESHPKLELAGALLHLSLSPRINRNRLALSPITESTTAEAPWPNRIYSTLTTGMHTKPVVERR